MLALIYSLYALVYIIISLTFSVISLDLAVPKIQDAKECEKDTLLMLIIWSSLNFATIASTFFPFLRFTQLLSLGTIIAFLYGVHIYLTEDIETCDPETYRVFDLVIRVLGIMLAVFVGISVLFPVIAFSILFYLEGTF